MLLEFVINIFDSAPGKIITQSDYSERFIFETNGQSQNELFDNYRTLSMEDCCLDRFRKIFNVRNSYDNGGEYVHQSNDTVRGFPLHLSYSKLQNSEMTTQSAGISTRSI